MNKLSELNQIPPNPYAIVSSGPIERGILNQIEFEGLTNLLGCKKREMSLDGRGVMLRCPYVFCFGVSPDKWNNNRFKLGVALAEKGMEMEDDVKEFVDELRSIEEWVKEKVSENYEVFGLSEKPIERDFKRMNPIYTGSSGSKMMSLKLMSLGNRVMTRFIDEEGNEIQIGDLIGKYCKVKFGIHIAGVIIKDDKVSLDIKVVIARIRRFQESKRVRYAMPDEI